MPKFFLLYFRPPPYIQRNNISPPLARMRLMEFCHIIYIQMVQNGAYEFTVMMPNGVTFKIIIEIVNELRPQIFNFQPGDHIGIYPLASIVQRYIQLGTVQRHCGDKEIVKAIVRIIREEKFHYDRFADDTLIIQLAFRGTLKKSFYEIFNWVSSPLLFYHFSNSEYVSDR